MHHGFLSNALKTKLSQTNYTKTTKHVTKVICCKLKLNFGTCLKNNGLKSDVPSYFCIALIIGFLNFYSVIFFPSVCILLTKSFPSVRPTKVQKSNVSLRKMLKSRNPRNGHFCHNKFLFLSHKQLGHSAKNFFHKLFH